MSLLASIHSFLLSPVPRPENRSREQIERDLEDEFAFHLEMKARALMAGDGLARQDADAAARERFGDVEAVRSQCRRIALKERVMLQRVNFVMMAVVMLMVIAVGVQVLITQRHNTLALQAITAEITNMKYDALAAQRGGGQPETVAGNAADASSSMTVARVLVEGEVPGTGWHAIDLERGTFVNDLLEEIGARDDQWVSYRVGEVSSRIGPVPVAHFKSDHVGSFLRPGAELRVVNDDNIIEAVKQQYYLRQWREDGLGLWREVDEGGEAVFGGWRLQQSNKPAMHLSRGSNLSAFGVLFPPDGDIPPLIISLNPSGMTFSVAENASDVYFSIPWTVDQGRLILDFSQISAPTPQVVSVETEAPEIPVPSSNRRRVVFAQVSSRAGDSANDTRAKAVGDFVLQLFAIADPHDPGINQTIRNFLDEAERDLDAKYKDDPATAGMIRELIAARRRVFEHDAAIQEAATAEAKAQAVTDFLSNMLASANPQASSGVSAREILESASESVDERFANDPATAAAVRQRIEQVMRQHGGQDDAGEGDDDRGDADATTNADAEKERTDLLAARSRDEDDEYPKLSPFRAVRWKDYTPFVDINGTWGELVSIDGVPAEDIIDFCRSRYGERDRKRFTEDLVQVLMEMGQQPRATVKVEIKEWRTGAVMAVEQATMSEENRNRLRDTNSAASDDGPGYPVWDGQPPAPMKGADAGAAGGGRRAAREPPDDRSHEARGLARLKAEQIEQDLAALERAMLDRFSYLRLRGVELEPLLQQIRDELSAQQGASIAEFAQALQRLIARFGDGHAGVSGFSDLVPRMFAPFVMGDAGGRIVAITTDRTAFLDPEHPYLRAINGVPIERLIELAGAYVADGSPALKRRRSVSLVRCLGLLAPAAGVDFSQQISVELESADGASVRAMIVGAPQREPMDAPGSPRASNVLNGGIGYLRLSRMDRDDTRMALWMMPQFRATKGLVIDVRGNGGGTRDALLGLLPYFLPPDSPPQVLNVAAYRLCDAFKDDHLAARFMFRRDDARWSEAERRAVDACAATFKPAWMPPSQEFSDWHYLVISREGGAAQQPRVNEVYFYDKPVVVLMDGGCFSATDIFLGAFKGRPNITLMGTASSGGSGRKQSVRLPASGLEVSLSSMVSYLPDGRMYDLTGIEPDIEVQPTATDFLTGPDGRSVSDSQLDAALARLRELP